MIIIHCELARCPYYAGGACTNRSLLIDANGMCKQIWKNGSQSPYAFEPVEYRRAVLMELDTDWKEIPPEEPEKFHQITIEEYIGGLS